MPNFELDPWAPDTWSNPRGTSIRKDLAIIPVPDLAVQEFVSGFLSELCRSHDERLAAHARHETLCMSRLDELLCRVSTLLSKVEQVTDSQLAQSENPSDYLTTQQVAERIGCSYGEARKRMLDGRIKSVKDGRWIRTRWEWVEEYLAGKTVSFPEQPIPEAGIQRKKIKSANGFKKGGLAYDFLRSRPD